MNKNLRKRKIKALRKIASPALAIPAAESASAYLASSSLTPAVSRYLLTMLGSAGLAMMAEKWILENDKNAEILMQQNKLIDELPDEIKPHSDSKAEIELKQDGFIDTFSDELYKSIFGSPPIPEEPSDDGEGEEDYTVLLVCLTVPNWINTVKKYEYRLPDPSFHYEYYEFKMNDIDRIQSLNDNNEVREFLDSCPRRRSNLPPISYLSKACRTYYGKKGKRPVEVYIWHCFDPNFQSKQREREARARRARRRLVEVGPTMDDIMTDKVHLWKRYHKECNI
tara:strand:+ start:1660 stop:2505 length:846 start_codon:yes stop_codon:yes gene_type:complete